MQSVPHLNAGGRAEKHVAEVGRASAFILRGDRAFAHLPEDGSAPASIYQKSCFRQGRAAAAVRNEASCRCPQRTQRTGHCRRKNRGMSLIRTCERRNSGLPQKRHALAPCLNSESGPEFTLESGLDGGSAILQKVTAHRELRNHFLGTKLQKIARANADRRFLCRRWTPYAVRPAFPRQSIMPWKLRRVEASGVPPPCQCVSRLTACE